ncbi:MAG: ROK family protein [Bacillota bacterium]
MLYVAGIDLGGTKILTALADTEGRVVQEIKIPTQGGRGFDHVVERMAASVGEVLARQKAGRDELVAVGVGAPGPLDPSTGIVKEAPNLPGWHSVPLAASLAARVGVPVRIDNDANLAALGEHLFGAGRGTRDMVYVTVSTGIGGGLILNGELYRGAGRVAGEIGHLPIADAPACRCGGRGCLEALASGTAIAREARRLAKSGQAPGLLVLAGGSAGKITAPLVFEAAERGDPQAKEIVRSAAAYLGRGLAVVVNMLNPEMIVLGGGVMTGGSAMWDVMLRELQELVWEAALDSLQVVPAALGGRSGVMGAVAMALEIAQGHSGTGH